ncbi:MAG: DNA repair protein RecO [Selenomonadaceae bacterium]|nr:DNA repair protein RecO [Selenomonadaceae bacterium]
MQEKTVHAEGIILATTDFGDAHRVVTIFTKEFGKLDVNAYGCRRARSRLAGSMMMFNHVSVELLQGSKVDMVREAEVLTFFPITDDLLRIAYASLLFEIVNQMTPLNQKDEDIFFLLLNALRTFVERNPRIVCLIAACQFIAISGVLLQLDHCVFCGRPIDSDCRISIFEGGALCSRCANTFGNTLPLSLNTRDLINALIAFDWDRNSHLTLRSESLNSIDRIMIEHVMSITDRPLRSLKFLKQVVSPAAPA